MRRGKTVMAWRDHRLLKHLKASASTTAQRELRKHRGHLLILDALPRPVRRHRPDSTTSTTGIKRGSHVNREPTVGEMADPPRAQSATTAAERAMN
ncbi:MAG: hypothetical protein R3F65_29820 [bacterium]